MKKTGILLLIIVLFGVQACKKETTSIVLSGPVGINDTRTVGASAKELLSATTYTSLNVEIQYAPGMRPQDQSISNLRSFLEARLNKPDSITIILKQVGSIGKPTINVSDISVFADKNRSSYTDGNKIAIYMYLADADFEKNGVLGVAYRNTSICLFQKTIQANSGGVSQASRIKVESGVLLHEVGHLLGLVNNGIDMVAAHEDNANPAHCTNNNCLMYFSIETTGLLNLFNNGIPQLDAACLNDLRGNGGR